MKNQTEYRITNAIAKRFDKLLALPKPIQKPIKFEGWTICILNKEFMEYGNSQFKANTNYRVNFDEDGKGCVVFGEWMSLRKFKANFYMYIPVLQERLTKLGLIVEGKPVSFKEFKERLNIYGRGYINAYIYSHPKENLFAFYPRGTETRVEGIKMCYTMYVDLVNGNWEYVDADRIRWGNCGLPLGGGYPRRNELEYFNPNKFTYSF